MEAELQTDIVVRPVRDVDAEALGRVHATCWHETYDHLISKAALEKISPRRMAELWTHWAAQGPEFKMFAALVDEDEPLDLWVADDNPRAHGFYVRNGFQTDGASHTEPFLGETLTEV